MVVDLHADPEQALKFVLTHPKTTGDRWHVYPVVPGKRDWRYCYYVLVLSIMARQWLAGTPRASLTHGKAEWRPFGLHVADDGHRYHHLVAYYYEVANERIARSRTRYPGIPFALCKAVRSLLVPRRSKGSSKDPAWVEADSAATADTFRFWTVDDLPLGMPERRDPSVAMLDPDQLAKSSVTESDLRALKEQILCAPFWVNWRDQAAAKRAAASKPDTLTRLRTALANDAQRALETPFPANGGVRPVDLRVSLGEFKPVQRTEDRDAMPDAHPTDGRIWRDWNQDELVVSRGKYFLSAVSGAGKSTFLRQIQQRFSALPEWLPVYFEAAHLSNRSTLDWPGIKLSLCTQFRGIASEKMLSKLLEDAFKSGHVLFLVDGMDRLGTPGMNCSELVTDIIDMTASNPVVLAGRPSAARWGAARPDLGMLRLHAFDEAQRKDFLGSEYWRVNDLVPDYEEVLQLPMLAHLAKRLPTTEGPNAIRSLWDLYSAFIHHALYEHSANRQKMNHDQWAEDVAQTLGELSYRAIDRPRPVFEEMSREILKDCLPREQKMKAIDAIPHAGLADILQRDTLKGGVALKFLHQSFQEFLAAVWVSQDEDRIVHVLHEYWDPKWHPVIRFLAGSEVGERVISALAASSENDAPVHASLLLAVELCWTSAVGQESRRSSSEAAVYGAA